jgi:hypothetical protein
MRFAVAAMAAALLLAPAFAQELEIPEGGFAVSDDLSQLPDAVAVKRAALIEAAAAGDIEALRPIFEGEPAPPTVSFGGPEDAIDYLRQQSKDGEGLEMLAILLDLLDAPYAAQDGGDGEAVYVWPYLAAMEGLPDVGPADRIEGIRIAGYDGFKEIQDLGLWYWWRVYIGEDGDLQAFVAGD